MFLYRSVQYGTLTACQHLVDYPAEYVQKILQKKLSKTGSDIEKLSALQWERHICSWHFNADSQPLGDCMNACYLQEEGYNTVRRIIECDDSIGTVVVGFEEVSFTVHRDLICRHSQYFKGAFEGGFSEATDGVVVLKQESVKDFALFAAWLYTGNIELPDADELTWYSHYERKVQRATEAGMAQRDGDSDGSDEASEDCKTTDDQPDQSVIQSLLIDLFIFADRRGVSGLRNDIIDLLAIQRESGWSLVSGSAERVGAAYSSLPSNSMLCRYLIEEAAYGWDFGFGAMDSLQEFPPEFMAAVMKCMLLFSKRKGIKFAPDWRDDMCIFHDHDSDAERERCEAAHLAWQAEMDGRSALEAKE
ncbi:hypothetical protein LTR65_010877 [Meristemomyces frigidus]